MDIQDQMRQEILIHRCAGVCDIGKLLHVQYSEIRSLELKIKRLRDKLSKYIEREVKNEET